MHAHALGREDFVGLAVLENAVLVDARAVREAFEPTMGLCEGTGS